MPKGVALDLQDPCGRLVLEPLDRHEEQHFTMGDGQCPHGGFYLAKGAGRVGFLVVRPHGFVVLAAEEKYPRDVEHFPPTVGPKEVPRDRQQERQEVSVLGECRGGLREPNERFLSQIFCRVALSRESNQEREDPRTKGLEHGPEGLCVTLSETRYAGKLLFAIHAVVQERVSSASVTENRAKDRGDPAFHLRERNVHFSTQLRKVVTPFTLGHFPHER